MAAAASAGVGSAGLGCGRHGPVPGTRRRDAGRAPRGAGCAAAGCGVSVNARGVVPAMPCFAEPLARRAVPRGEPARVCARRARAPRAQGRGEAGVRTRAGGAARAGESSPASAWELKPERAAVSAPVGGWVAPRRVGKRCPRVPRGSGGTSTGARGTRSSRPGCDPAASSVPPPTAKPPGRCNIRTGAPRHKRALRAPFRPPRGRRNPRRDRPRRARPRRARPRFPRTVPAGTRRPPAPGPGAHRGCVPPPFPLG